MGCLHGSVSYRQPACHRYGFNRSWRRPNAKDRRRIQSFRDGVYLAAPKPALRAALRIFTPGFEVPFAGHPTVGSAVALARARDLTGSFTLELAAGLFDVALSSRDGVAFAEFSNPNLPIAGGPGPAASMIEAALSLPSGAISNTAQKCGRAGAGVDFIYANALLEHVQAARLDYKAWEQINLDGAVGVLLYAQTGGSPADGQSRQHHAHFHVRMFAPEAGIAEDPATGAAAAALPGHIHAASRMADGTHYCLIEQGIEMGRPSRINVTVNIVDGAITNVRVGGSAIRVAEARLFA